MYAVAHPLRLDYMGLKKPLGGAPSLRRKPAKPAFVELIAPHPTTLEECIIEFESLFALGRFCGMLESGASRQN
jgi:hypothetical protein